MDVGAVQLYDNPEKLSTSNFLINREVSRSVCVADLSYIRSKVILSLPVQGRL